MTVTMDYRRLGATAFEISAVAFGGAPIGLANYLDRWNPNDPQDEARAVHAIHAALEAGITYFDTAASYGDGRSEQIIGKALAMAGEAGKRAVIATKVSKRDRAGIFASAERSLQNLGVETIDVFQFHGSRWTDEETAAILDGEGLAAFQELRAQGKIRSFGFTAEIGSPGVYRLIRSGAFDVLQIAYNVLYQDACNFMVKSGPILEAKERGMGVVTMRSLSSGVFQKLLQQHLPGLPADVDLHAFALNFVLSNRYVDSAIVGMRTVEEVHRNAAIAASKDSRIDLELLHQRYV